MFQCFNMLHFSQFLYWCIDSLSMVSSAETYSSKQRTVLLCILYVHMLVL
jgi:hypothetical protein